MQPTPAALRASLDAASLRRQIAEHAFAQARSRKAAQREWHAAEAARLAEELMRVEAEAPATTSLEALVSDALLNRAAAKGKRASREDANRVALELVAAVEAGDAEAAAMVAEIL